jgi:hypothetical protein
MITLSLVLALQTGDQIKSTFNDAIIKSDGAKLHSVLSAKELNGATAKACTQFLTLVTKPRIPKVGVYTDQARKTFLSILDPKSPMTIRFRSNSGADIQFLEKRKWAFEPALTPDGKKAQNGFADLAFWCAHLDAQKTAKGRLDRAKQAHNQVKAWIPKFESYGIKGSIDGESKKYMNWKQILDTSAKEIAKIKP